MPFCTLYFARVSFVCGKVTTQTAPHQRLHLTSPSCPHHKHRPPCLAQPGPRACLYASSSLLTAPRPRGGVTPTATLPFKPCKASTSPPLKMTRKGSRGIASRAELLGATTLRRKSTGSIPPTWWRWSRYADVSASTRLPIYDKPVLSHSARYPVTPPSPLSRHHHHYPRRNTKKASSPNFAGAP